MPSLAIVVVLGFAAFRVTRVATADSITQPWRELLYRFAWDADHPVVNHGLGIVEPAPRAGWRTWFYELMTCPWCLGVWVSIGVYTLWRWGGDVGLAVVAVAGVAGVQGFIAAIVASTED